MRVALSFLTRLPVGSINTPDYFAALGRQTPLFPVVGALVGGISALTAWATGFLFGPPVQAAAAVAAGVWVTGALHLDGLMDTADGVGSHRSRERMLEIMKDSRVGAMGVLAGVLALLLRFAFLLETDRLYPAIIIAPVLGRATLATAAGLFPSVASGGLGASFAAHVSRNRIALTIAVALVIALIAGQRGLAAWAVALTTGLLAARSLTARLGGLTGDTYGAINEVAEIAALAALTAVLPW